MKQHAKEKTVPPPRKDDTMTHKESLLSALLGVVINVMAMVFAGVFLAIIFPSATPVLDAEQLTMMVLELVVICFFVVWIRSRF